MFSSIARSLCLERAGLLRSTLELQCPLHALLKTFAGLGTASLNLPLTVTDVGQGEFLSDLVSGHRVQQILLVGENKNGHATQLVLGEEIVQLGTGFLETSPISGIDNVDQNVRGVEIVLPVRANCLLSADIPHIQKHLHVVAT